MEEHITVGDFAKATGRFPNQIYDLINKGNKFRKLKVEKIKGQLMVPKSEIKEFPFNETVALAIEIRKDLKDLVQRLEKLEADLNAHCNYEGAHGI